LDDGKVVLCPVWIGGAENAVGGDVVEKIAAPRMNFKEVVPMIVVVRGEI
jgi:hypothetical protein